jgi:hypothetical protein
MNVIVRETISTLQIVCTDIFHVNTIYCKLKNKCITRKYNRQILIIHLICQLCYDFFYDYKIIACLCIEIKSIPHKYLNILGQNFTIKYTCTFRQSNCFFVLKEKQFN